MTAANLNVASRDVLLLALEQAPRFGLSIDDATGALKRARGRTHPRVHPRAAAKRASEWVQLPNSWCAGYWRSGDGLAVVPVWGDVGPQRHWVWASYEDITLSVTGAGQDPSVRAILLDIDSPGGYVTGVAECAASIEAVAAIKPMAAYAHDLAASAAYWLACAAGRVEAPRTGIVGSIGALQIHAEISQMLATAGVKIEVIRSAPRKAEGSPFEPLTDVARGQMQTEVGVAAGMFATAVARLRSLQPAIIEGTQGACLTARDAQAAGLLDAISTFSAASRALIARAGVAPVPSPAAAPAAKSSQPSRRAQTRSVIMDPTELPEEDRAARREEIATIVAEEPADPAAAALQFDEVAAVVNRPAENAEGEEAPTDAAPPADETAAQARARAARLQRRIGADVAIARSKEAQSNPAAALAAIAGGMTLAQWKVMAPTLGKGGGFAAKMAGEGVTVGADGKPKAEGKVVAINTANIYAARKAAAGGGKK